MVDAPQYTYNKLRGRIIEMYGSQNEFAKVLHTSPNVISEKLNCKKGFSQRDMEKWAKFLQFSIEDFGTYFFT